MAEIDDVYLVGGGKDWPLARDADEEVIGREGDEGRGGEGLGGEWRGKGKGERVMGEKSKRE